ncbi:Urb2/Npa2 family-domain-containing protein [Pyrenochaeta sp. MPI-SDFR-AT-0127]|nr:Urb2/Npa2 family-domain-containing protein [Pyrenochaeta sp. MPI-SDFR-AT-0127]
MAQAKTNLQNGTAPTRPRLQSINQDFSDLNEQLRQAAHIIGLPGGWETLQDEEARSEVIRCLVRARAEWVLRWILDKMKDETDAGRTARGHPTAWKLLDWMLHVLPVTRSAPHLRDASYPSILERTLLENFDKDTSLEYASTTNDTHMMEASETSETIHEDTLPSRKRKRGTATATPSKHIPLGFTKPGELFQAVRSSTASIAALATEKRNSDDTTQSELMKMVLRTESAQASRILKFWFTGVHQLISALSATASHKQNADQYLDLSLVVNIWELRTIDSKDDAGTSAEDFSGECLVPTLILLDTLESKRKSNSSQCSPSVVDSATQVLDTLLARHLISPSRAAFFTAASPEGPLSDSGTRKAEVLASHLEPLQAKLLQAAQIEDAGEALTPGFASLFNAIPHLLDLAIRASPSRTPKGRLVERPWIQAIFSSLAECAGCSLNTPPTHVTRQTAVAALEGALRILQLQSVSIDSEILKKLLWYHCGVKYPERHEKIVHWSLIANLIELDPSSFVTEPRLTSKTSHENQADLAEFIFEQISITEFSGPGFAHDEVADNDENKKNRNKASHQNKARPRRTVILEQIVVPLMVAFARNRNLLGFLRRWDHQLVRSYKYENRKALQERQCPIWEDRTINKALSKLFEQSLTQSQIAALLQEHAKRLAEFGDAMDTGISSGVHVKKLASYKGASSSSVIIPAVLQSIQSDETIEGLQQHLHSLLQSYASWIQDDRYSFDSRLAFSWFTMCQLLTKLWPSELHGSSNMQKELLHPLIEQATQDMSSENSNRDGRHVNSLTRAAAMMFLLDACNYLQTSSGSKDLIEESLRKVMESLSTDLMDPEEHAKMIEFFCADFVMLLEHIDDNTCCKSLLVLLSKVADFGDGKADLMSTSLSQSIIEQGSSALQKAYATALLQALKQEDDSALHDMVIKALLHIQSPALSRETRESILDRATELLCTTQNNAIELLSLMVHLLEVPNATAKVSTDSKVIFNIAEQLHKYGIESPTALQLLRQVVESTLGHVISNQNQAQNASYLAVLTSKLDLVVKAPKLCSEARLSVLRATMNAQKSTAILHPGRYVELLKQCLTNIESRGKGSASLDEVLDAFNDLTLSALEQEKLWDNTQAWLRTWVNDNSDLQSYMASSGPSPVTMAEYVARLQTIVAKFGLYPSTKWLIDLTIRVFQEPISDGTKRRTIDSIKETLAPLPVMEKLALVPALTDVFNPQDQTAAYNILSCLITTMDDKVERDTDLKQKQHALLPRIAILLAESPDYACFNALLNSINIILNDKPSLASQYSIESVVSVLVKLTSRSSPALPTQHAPEIFSRLCETGRLILLVHRGRLGGRFHLLLPLLQGLLFCLFIPNASRSGALPIWLRTVVATEPVRLTPASANQLSRLLSTLCNPPQSSITKAHQHHASRKSKDLNDPVKAAREKASHFLYPLLASFCRFQLHGRLEPSVKEKLMPGIWEVVGTASLHKEALDAMFAGLGRSERDVWRGIWSEWEGIFGRKQITVNGE